MAEERRISGVSPYERSVGFSRALRIGDVIEVAGTAPIRHDGSCPESAEDQADLCFDIAIDALRRAGAAPRDVVRTRMYLTDAGDAEAVGRAHGRRFSAVRPAATMVVVAGLIDPRWKVEIELSAIIR